jgi:uncharacterized protein
MKFHADQIEAPNVVQSHNEHGVRVQGKMLNHSVIIPWQGAITPWPVNAFEQLTAHHFEAIAAMAPEVVILGCGAGWRHVHPAVLQPLMVRRVGVETMDNGAACRTYNVLLGEGRSVLLALLIPRV